MPPGVRRLVATGLLASKTEVSMSSRSIFSCRMWAYLYMQNLYILQLCWMALRASIGICTTPAMLLNMESTRSKSRKRSSGLTQSFLQKPLPARSVGRFSVRPRPDGIWS